MKAMFTKSSFMKQEKNFRIGTIISDGQWYSSMKWRKLAGVTEDEIDEWIYENLNNGRLLQSSTGSKSYRFPHASIIKWYRENNLELGTQIVDFIFPPRIWGGKTETEGFLETPLREIGVVQFYSSQKVCDEVTRRLKGIARVREEAPGKYKAYGLNSTYIKDIIEKVFVNYDASSFGKTNSRSLVKRREIVDFDPRFQNGIVEFYKEFGKSLVKSSMETISLFLPEKNDQESQMVVWVITAIEKFDQTAAVPFSGYLNSVLKRWPYDLPYNFLGKDLSNFQREKSRAIKALDNDRGLKDHIYSNQELADYMKMSISDFNELEERNNAWRKNQTATSLTWEENSDEKLSSNVSGNLQYGDTANTDIDLAHNLSLAIIHAALETGDYQSGFFLMSQMDAPELNKEMIATLPPEFVKELGSQLGL